MSDVKRNKVFPKMDIGYGFSRKFRLNFLGCHQGEPDKTRETIPWWTDMLMAMIPEDGAEGWKETSPHSIPCMCIYIYICIQRER
jgi:hypothetical protein